MDNEKRFNDGVEGYLSGKEGANGIVYRKLMKEFLGLPENETAKLKDNPKVMAVMLKGLRIQAQKEKAYGDTWKKNGLETAFSELSRKYNRLDNIINGDGEVNMETLEDTSLDLMNYAALLTTILYEISQPEEDGDYVKGILQDTRYTGGDPVRDFANEVAGELELSDSVYQEKFVDALVQAVNTIKSGGVRSKFGVDTVNGELNGKIYRDGQGVTVEFENGLGFFLPDEDATFDEDDRICTCGENEVCSSCPSEDDEDDLCPCGMYQSHECDEYGCDYDEADNDEEEVPKETKPSVLVELAEHLITAPAPYDILTQDMASYFLKEINYDRYADLGGFDKNVIVLAAKTHAAKLLK